MNKIRKILVAICVCILIILVAGNVNAERFLEEDVDGIIKDGLFFPTQVYGNWWFCREPNGGFDATLSREEYTKYPVGSKHLSDYVCMVCNPDVKRPWEGDKFYMVYTQDGEFDAYEHQDAAYSLADATERGTINSWETAYAIWESSVSEPKRYGGWPLAKEAQAYKIFYENIHDGRNDVFNSKILDGTNTASVDVGVNQSNGTYTVGPFKVSYPDGQYNKKNIFSWINSVKAVTDVGTLDVELLSSGGGKIEISELGKDGSETLNGKEFYIRFSSTSATNVKVQIDFEYLESCSAQMLKYEGRQIYRYWELDWVSEFCYNHVVNGGEYDSDGDGVNDSINWIPNPQTGYRFELKERYGGPTQKTMALAGTASKNYRKTSKILAPSGIDLTMKIAGTVFLDQDTGKVNEGNNKSDSGEGLPGVEVYLYQAGGSEVGRTHTDSNGNYSFSGLNSQKDYYVTFVYNAMLYTNVERLLGNANDISKATEDVTQYPNNRQNFNNKFAEISSNPQNYKIRNKVFGNELGDYNKVYLQEEVADLFKEVASNYGDISKWKNADIETKRKVQFVVDCRITAYSSVYNDKQKAYQIQTYPLLDVFTVDSSWNVIAGQGYNPIYAGAYNQLHVNLGIKARPTFDMALYKDVFNAVLNINGKTETYTYDARKDWKNEGFSFGVNEADYLNQLRAKYISGTNTNLQTKEVIDEGEYIHEYRTEEIINGNNQHTAINDTNLYDENKNYAWRDINHSLTDADKLQIHVTYKLAVRNQSDVVGSVTEIVDYYDSHYQFEKAYVGDENGNEIAGTKVDVSENSMYGANTQALANGQWTVENEKRSYKTIYLRPTEKKLYADDKEQYIYVTFGLINPEQTLVDAGLPDGNKLYTYNLAEINGYKTYGTTADYKANPNNTASMGLVDRDSNPGNLNPATYVMGKTALEDDESKAPAYVYSHRNSRTLEGTVFEDMLSNVSGNKATASKKENEVKVNTTRFGSGTIDDSDKKVQGVKVELVEVKNGSLISRQTTYTNSDGWYGFGAFLPGDYTIRFTYGAEDKTALTTTSQYTQGLNDTSYNGQDYESTIYGVKTSSETNTEIRLDTPNYKTDTTLINVYQTNYENRNAEESKGLLSITDTTGIDKYTKLKKQENGTLVEELYYWYAQDDKLSDARDDAYRRELVTAYSKSEYGKEITNHKAEVFNSYINQNTLREAESKDKSFEEFTQAQPMDEAVDNKDKNRELVNELERRTYMYAYTPEIPVEVEYTTQEIAGNLSSDKYTYKITGVDFGVVERPRAQLTIDQDVKHIKVTASDGSVLFDTENGVNNLQWVAKGDVSKYDKNELINIILDDELLSGSKVEVTYNITVTNNSEAGIGTSRAKTIINYVANNLNFDLSDNNGLWEAVKKEDIQTSSHSTYINNATNKNNVKLVDLSTQTTVLKATDANPLTKALNPGESVTSTLTLKKTLSAESSSDDLSYSNLTEIVEIDNEVGRYDYGAIPGNQSLEEQPREHDTSGSSRYDETDNDSGTENVKTRYPQDGEIIVTPPTGSKMIYYVLGITATLILALGIIIIKKFVIRKK